MSVRVAINGFGRIGRAVFRIIMERQDSDIDVVAINDLADDEILAYLLRHDTVMGPFPGRAEVEGDHLTTDRQSVKMLSEREPGGLPWKELGIDAVVEATGENVLLLRPAIINLDVFAPDTMSTGRSRTYTDQAGEMTIYLEIRDSITGAMLAKGMDRQADRQDAFMTWQSRVQNTQAARRILRNWATSLREGLDRAHANGGTPTPPDAD